jgi:hypothetical protein
MKKNRGKRGGQMNLKAWTFSEAVSALPYVRSILDSLRELALERNRLRLGLGRLQDYLGRPRRSDLIAQADMESLADHTEAAYLEALDELLAIGVECLDPIQGGAAFPFLHENQVAWFIYHLYEGSQLRWWRYDSDSLDTRRAFAVI